MIRPQVNQPDLTKIGTCREEARTVGNRSITSVWRGVWCLP